MRRWIGAVWIALSVGACVSVNGPAGEGVLVRGAGSVPEARLRAAIEPRVGNPSQGPAAVVGTFRWYPVDGTEVLVWVTCRGAGNGRSCTVAVGRMAADGGLRVMRYVDVGWSVPGISAGQDRRQLLLEGDDGRGTWRQLMAFDPEGGGTLETNRRQYADGF